MNPRSLPRHLAPIVTAAALCFACSAQEHADADDDDDAQDELDDAADADLDELAGEPTPQAALSAPFTLHSPHPELSNYYAFWVNDGHPLLDSGPITNDTFRRWRTDELGRIHWNTNTNYCMERQTLTVSLKPCSSATAQKWSFVAVAGHANWYYVKTAVTSTTLRCIESAAGQMDVCSDPLLQAWVKTPA